MMLVLHQVVPAVVTVSDAEQIVDRLVASVEDALVDDVEHPVGALVVGRGPVRGHDLQELIADMGGILLGDQTGRDNEDQIIVYAVGGMPVEDVAWAYDCYQNAKEKKIGTVLPVWDEPELMK